MTVMLQLLVAIRNQRLQSPAIPSNYGSSEATSMPTSLYTQCIAALAVSCHGLERALNSLSLFGQERRTLMHSSLHYLQPWGATFPYHLSQFKSKG